VNQGYVAKDVDVILFEFSLTC